MTIINKKLNIFWKSLFYILIFILLFSTIGIAVEPEIINEDLAWTIVSLVFFSISILSLYGFAWKKKILSVLFWKIFFVLSIALNIIFGIIKFDKVYASLSASVFDIIAVLLLTITVYIPIYFYAFKSQHIWERTTSKENKKTS